MKTFERGDHAVVQWDARPQTVLVLYAGLDNLFVVPCPFAHTVSDPALTYVPDPYKVARAMCVPTGEDYSACACLSVLQGYPGERPSAEVAPGWEFGDEDPRGNSLLCSSYPAWLLLEKARHRMPEPLLPPDSAEEALPLGRSEAWRVLGKAADARWGGPVELHEELERLRAAIRKHRAQKADDRCVEDDDELYAALGDGILCDRRVGDKEAMLRNCARFIERRTTGGGWPTYAEIEARLALLERHVRTLIGSGLSNLSPEQFEAFAQLSTLVPLSESLPPTSTGTIEHDPRCPPGVSCFPCGQFGDDE